MKPVLLKIKGFTSFRDEAAIDFAGLELFAICGPTGSGKSSLLDALTYALFGTVERVGRQVTQLIAQGHPRMAVELHFEVEGARYRVTRTTPRSGSTKAVLQRLEGDEWVSAGEGADRVTEINRRIVRLIGMDYDAFTRSVLLPQGRFAEFLVGEPSKRREILTDLLGLSLFKRMAQRANEIAKESRQKAETTAELLEREYEGVTPETFETARASATAAAAREEALAQAAARVQHIAERWAATDQAIKALRGCARDTREVVAVLDEGAAAVASRVAAIEALVADETARRVAAESAKEAAAGAVRARADTEARFGTVAALAEARAAAGSITSARDEVTALAALLEDAQARTPVLHEALATAETALVERQRAAEAAERALEDARDEYARRQRRELLAAACEGVHAGDACPVCGSTLADDPPRPSKDLEAAKTTGTRLKAAWDAAAAAVRDAQRVRDGAERDVAEQAKEVARLEREIATRRGALATAEKALAAIFDGSVPDDPVSVLTERIASLESLARAERDAAAGLQRAEDAVRDAERALSDARSAIAAERARLEAQPLASLVGRARDLGVSISTPLPAPQDAHDPAALVGWARATAETTARFADELDGDADRRAGGERGLLAEATEALGDLVPPAASLTELLATLPRALAGASASRATAEQHAAMLAERLEKRAVLKADVDALDLRAERFRMLALELRADHLVAFLQGEALQVLCVAGTEHLLRLSDGRYRLVCDQDEFEVVDTWNGDERRSVKTLSGGETFMASLALALALSEQQPSLAVETTARIESLFLDEGFGTLDPESLEALGGDGRMVGVITHIAELADRLPSKIVVEKSPRGSRVSLA